MWFFLPLLRLHWLKTPESNDDDSGGGGFADIGHDESPPNPIEVPARGIASEASNRVGVHVSGDDDTYEATRAGDSDDDTSFVA